MNLQLHSVILRIFIYIFLRKIRDSEDMNRDLSTNVAKRDEALHQTNVCITLPIIWVSEWLLFNAKWAILFSYIMARTSWFSIKWWWCPLCTVLDQHAELDFYSASWLKQWSSDRHVAPLGHIILIPSQPVFALSP
jgi:hypothetical protein